MKHLKAIVIALASTTLWSCSSSENQENTDSSPTTPPEELETSSAAATQVIEQGEAVYGQYCVACHQTDGNGMSGAFPPLSQTKWVEGDKAELIGIILNGMQGPITVKGEEYNNVMASHDFLSDEDIAAVLTYVRQSFGNSASEVAVAEVAEARKANEASSTGN